MRVKDFAIGLTLAIGMCLLMFLQGCSSFGLGKPAVAATETTPAQPAQSGLQVKATADLAQTIEEAKAATGAMAPLRLQCWEYLQSHVTDLPDFGLGGVAKGPSAGVFNDVERAGELAEGVHELLDYQIPDELKVELFRECGPAYAAFKGMMRDFRIKFVKAGAKVSFLLGL